MTLPPLYKYLDVKGAKLTLANGTLKHSKPSDFNDLEDLTIQSIFPEETEAALQRIALGFTDVILQHLNDAPTCASPMREKVSLVQQVFLANPGAAELVKAEMAAGGVDAIYDVDHMRTTADAFLHEINDFMQEYRVLCVSSRIDSGSMWSSYAEGHHGVAVRIQPNLERDSKFQRFRPVVYRKERPSLYDDTLDFVTGGLFGNQQDRLKVMLDKIIYSKTLEWESENEYRLAIPLALGEKPWNTLRYHPEELTELYLGAEMEEGDMAEIVGLAFQLNPDISVFQLRFGDEEDLLIEPQ